ncbi:MAG TPA: argininosuccinate lyase [Pirellulaceae bacterium]|nr:argininosuccinate lyase [Pirellulaceae bacterium]
MATPSRSGVFSKATDRRVERFTESVSFDHRLFAHDIAGSIAHAQMLAAVGLINEQECRQICDTLQQIRGEIEAGKFPLRTELEDIHMHIEQALIERLGDVGRKLHTGRSRNDQVATDLRMWIRDALDRVDSKILELQRAFIGRCDDDFDVILPGYTHLQRAQPVLAPHYWLAYCEKLQRDRLRVMDCRRRVNVSSLGAAALAGSSLPIDRQDVARRLGFEAVAANSLDISSDRDFVLETAFVLTLIAEHLSTWAEEWILWSTAEFNFLKLPQEFCTGSSIMPQKVNPDVLELTRGKTARVIGNLQSLLVLVKGLPLAYNRDLQEDKERIFDSFDTVELCLELAAPLVAGTALHRQAIAEQLDRGHLDATTLMEWLILRGMPQRTAHHLVGQLVGTALARGCRLADLAIADFRAADPSLDESVYGVLGASRAVNAFRSYGSTAPGEVRKQIDRWKQLVGHAS